MANQDGVPVDVADVAISYAGALIARGDLERAVPVAGLVDRHAARNYDAAVLQVRLYRALGQTEAWRSALAGERAGHAARAGAVWRRASLMPRHHRAAPGRFFFGPGWV